MITHLLTRIDLMMNSFSKGQKRIALYIEEHYDKAAFMTASKLGETVGVSESTVVRFASELGYDGYPKLQKAMQEMIRNKLTSVQRIEVTSGRIGDDNVLDSVLNQDIEKIRSYVDSETAIICDANGEPIMNMGFEKPSKNARKITITVNGEQREYYSSQLIWKNKGKGISKTAQYKLAGNSICIAPMYHIFRKLFVEKECESNQLTLF